MAVLALTNGCICRAAPFQRCRIWSWPWSSLLEVKLPTSCGETKSSPPRPYARWWTAEVRFDDVTQINVVCTRFATHMCTDISQFRCKPLRYSWLDTCFEKLFCDNSNKPQKKMVNKPPSIYSFICEKLHRAGDKSQRCVWLEIRNVRRNPTLEFYGRRRKGNTTAVSFTLALEKAANKKHECCF